MEEKSVRKLGVLLDNGRKKLEKMGLTILYNGDTIKNNVCSIHLTRRTEFIHQFLIMRLDKGQIKKPDEEYFSEGYPEPMKEKSNPQVLYEFIEHLKTKRKVLKLPKFLKIKK